jgi:hypothetical protein
MNAMKFKENLFPTKTSVSSGGFSQGMREQALMAKYVDFERCMDQTLKFK